MKKQTVRRAVAAFLVVSLILIVIHGAGRPGPYRQAEAAEEVLIGQTRRSSETPKYLLVQLNSDPAWNSSWNDLHYVYPKGKPEEQYVAYCLESHRTSPSGESYRVIEKPNYSAKTERGLKTIFRMGYPYTVTFGDNGEYVFDATDAQAVTQIAIRFWMAYRQVCEPSRDYHVIENLDPYKKRVKAADSEAARRVYNAAMWLFRLADNGYSPTFGMRATTVASAQPETVGDGGMYRMTVRVDLQSAANDLPCEIGRAHV